jgi:hypothetical protein
VSYPLYTCPPLYKREGYSMRGALWGDGRSEMEEVRNTDEHEDQ